MFKILSILECVSITVCSQVQLAEFRSLGLFTVQGWKKGLGTLWLLFLLAVQKVSLLLSVHESS